MRTIIIWEGILLWALLSLSYNFELLCFGLCWMVNSLCCQVIEFLSLHTHTHSIKSVPSRQGLYNSLHLLAGSFKPFLWEWVKSWLQALYWNSVQGPQMFIDILHFQGSSVIKIICRLKACSSLEWISKNNHIKAWT